MEQGDADIQFKLVKVQFNIGNMSYNGRGFTQNCKDSVKCYRLSSEQGHSRTQTTIGQMYALC